ncbi:hypothetical protein [Blastopirellula marina]|uniref:Uncharacterized protein n=1 Tax=Blastopirellula marina TaxID=124 RepID=A0A2S8GLR1_9BACT|nr:hypothetical protein [Blastopirellula marina]PQO45376.1 hypothetical protein C5Y93_13050 [Blastopirellula marina]
MPTKRPVLLTVLIEAASKRWYLAGIDLEGNTTPLLCSEEDNLAGYIGQPLDDQTSFLRHHLAGVLQRGTDRLWGRQEKPCQIVFVADDHFQDAPAELTERVAEHFVEWLTRPPVVFFLLESSRETPPPELKLVAGEIDSEGHAALVAGLPKMFQKCTENDPWELVLSKRSKA